MTRFPTVFCIVFPALAALTGCTPDAVPIDESGDAMPPSPPAGIDLPVDREPSLTAEPYDAACDGELIHRTTHAFGAIGVADDGAVFVGGSTTHGNPWQLARFEPSTGDLNVLIDEPTAYTYENWMSVEDDRVRVYEFYPSFGYIDYDRNTGEVTRDMDVTIDPTWNALPYAWDGAVIDMVVGGDDCGNRCLVRELPDGSVEVLVDDANAPFSIHGNALTYVEEYAYFNTYASTTSLEDFDTLRRLNLDTGAIEVVHAFEQDGWISHITAAEDGRVFWVREDHTQGTVDLDVHEIDSNITTLGFSTVAPISAVWDVQIADDTLFWTDEAGLHNVVTDVDGNFGLAYTVRDASPDATLFHFAVTDDAVWYTESTYVDNSDYAATLGCFAR